MANNFLDFKLIAFICLHFSLFSQKKIEFEITYGSYTNDHANRTFHAQERKWILKKEKLIYFIDAHDKRYSDTLKLKKDELDSLIKFVNENKLPQTIKKDLDKDFLDKYEFTTTITGFLDLDAKRSDLNIKANSSSALDEDVDATRLKKLEELLYKITEAHRK